MKLRIERQYANALVSEFPELSHLTEQLRFGNKVDVLVNQLSNSELVYLRNLYQDAGPSMQGQAAQIATLQHALNDEGERFTADDLESLLPSIANYIVDNAIRGWLFLANFDGKALPYVITRLDFTPPGEEEAGRVVIELKANSQGKITTETLVIRARDIENKSVAEILVDKGFLKETEALIKAYDESAERYFDWRARYGEQFSARGIGVYAEDPTANRRERDWSRKSKVVLTSGDSDARLVNDESVFTERALNFEGSGEIFAKYLRKAGKSERYNYKIEQKVEASAEKLSKGLFTELPVHGFVLMFHLELHHHLWVHVDDMKLYQYQPGIKDKLVLPDEQIDLIDILTAEMDVLMDDVIEGKSGGTTVLCAGPPGVGKTLTAEVYSEIIQRPLYRVHSGQLGLNVTEMELALKETLTRAQRWGAIMLIDEADVYIKRRDDNIAANAVVGVFLRVLEYFNGLLFLTTNRVEDIDEAIISRCIAMIRYHAPNSADRQKLWSLMCDQFGLEVSQQLIDDLVALFPSATGRDIKGLAKLVAKFCNQKNLAPSVEVFKRCAVFRGLDPMYMS